MVEVSPSQIGRSVCCFAPVVVAASVAMAASNAPKDVPITVRETVVPSAIREVRDGDVTLAGRVRRGDPAQVTIRVTTSHADMCVTRATVSSGRFRCRYPSDFPAAPSLEPCMLFIDVWGDRTVDPAGTQPPTAEAALLIYDGKAGRLPEMPSAFTNDLLDARGRTDAESAEWPIIQTLVNLYMHSRAARIVGVGRPDFDLKRDHDLRYYKDSLALYEFDYRDREWSKPLAHRVRRHFWQAVWDRWFNTTNNHPLDGDDANNEPSNVVPYTFANDFADILIAYLMRMDLTEALDDNLRTMCREGLENLLVMQHRGPDTFAVRDRKGRTHTYTAGAFRYGMFENGDFLTEGKGWFYNPEHGDYLRGGVFNGRAIWGLGEGLKRFHKEPIAKRLTEAIRLGVGFCLNDAVRHGYARVTRGNRVCWYDPGEQGYLLLGLLAACEVAPELPVPVWPDGKGIPLAECCARSLGALLDLVKPHHQWMTYADKDSMVIAALADGARILKHHPDAPRWRQAATAAADAWLAARPDPSEYPAPPIHFGRRVGPRRMTYRWPDRTFIFFYKTGHWIHALAKLVALTGDERYRLRAEAMLSYLCGANPWQVRLLNEHGGVYNWVEDTDGDGIEDELKQDMYPESTAFCHIGVGHLLRAISRRAVPSARRDTRSQP